MFNRWMARMAARQAKVIAAERFVAVWSKSGLADSLTDDYECHLTCDEANAFAALFETFGHEGTAEWILKAHIKHDEPGDEHFPCPCDNHGDVACPEHRVG